MVITPIAHGLTLAAPAPGYVRSPGLHMSQLYGSLFAGLEPERFGGKEGPDPLRLELGLALEEGLEQSLKDRFKAQRPGEFTTEEGIIFTPDGLMFRDEGMRLVEIKLTWMSSADMPRTTASSFPSKFDKWVCQMQCYCVKLDTPLARLVAYFVNGPGSFTKKLGPELLAWDITFTARELKTAWTMVTNNAKHVGLLDSRGRPIPSAT